MAAEENKRVVFRFFDELWNERRLSAAADLFSPDCVTHQLRSCAADAPAAAPRTPEILKAHVAEWLSAFPDIHFAVEQVVAEGNLVAVRCTATGTHTGSWLGIPPTGKHVSIRMAVSYRLDAGQIAEDWVLVDFLGVFQQLGLVAPTSQLVQNSHEAGSAPS